MATIEELKKITEYAVKLQTYRISEEALLKRLSNLSGDETSKVGNLYRKASVATPVNLLRKKVADLLVEKKDLTKEWLIDQIAEIEEQINRLSFRSYTSFSILFPLIDVIDSPIDVNRFWKEIAAQMSLMLDFGPGTKKIHHVDFKGPRGFGADRTWLAIYNPTHPNQTTAKQFFFLIESQGLTISFYDRFNDRHIKRQKIDMSEHFLDDCAIFFKEFVSNLLEDTYDRLQNKMIGVRGNKVYKLSHGADYFDVEKTQYCITNNLAVVHVDTNAKGRQNFSQFDLFKSAKVGDIFYVTHGNTGVLLIGQFVDNVVSNFNYNPNETGWRQRNYKLLHRSSEVSSYSGSRAWWSPNDPSTFTEIHLKDFSKANRELFIPHFKVELDPNLITEIPSTRMGIGADMDIPTLDKNVDPKLDVNMIAGEFARLIHNMKSEKGQFLGIFGRWGRGKTFFAERVFDLINDSRKVTNVRYKTILFNAWKYQDSKAIWAYIYETLQEEYLNLARDKWLRKLVLIWKLNFARKGKKDLYILLLAFSTSFTFSYFIPAQWKVEFILFLLTNIGITVLLKAFLLYKKYTPQFKQVYKEYSKKTSFSSELGLQAEIQNEIKILLRTWFELKTHSKKYNWRWRYYWNRNYQKILFFVDDLDRCDESKIMQVIDSLRVMLEDPEIIDHIIIVGAIDETILKTAIEWKYKDILEFKDIEKENRIQHHQKLEITTREYIDKLFIGGIRLPALTQEEQRSILENYALNADILETEETGIPTASETGDENPEAIDSELNAEFDFPDSIYEDFVVPQDSYFLLQSELTYLSLSLQKLKVEFTPRQLRIYLNRFLLAKNLARAYLMKKTGLRELGNDYSLFLADQIAAKTADLGHNIDQDRLKRLNIESQLEEFTPKLIEMVVAY